MLILLHGDDIAASRKNLNEEIASVSAKELIRMDGTKIQMPELLLAFESQSLFFESKTIVIEGLLTNLTKKGRQENALYVASHHTEHTVILWESKVLDKAIIKKYAASAKEISSMLPSQLFTFLDSFGIVSSDKLIMYFHQLLRSQEAELVYAMLLRQLRFLIQAKDGGRAGLPGMAPWQADKILRQSSKFSSEQLLLLYRSLLSVDMKIKTGQTPFSMSELLDIWLITN